MQDHIFRPYDIRGVVGSELLVEQVYDFARTVAFYGKQRNASLKRVALGYDGRTHSPALVKELVAGLCSSGLEVILLGCCTTPIIYFSQYWLPVQMGIMVTASHNPGRYNGFKIFIDRKPVVGQDLQQLKLLWHQKKTIHDCPQAPVTHYELIPEYVQFLKTLFPHLVGLELSIVFDPGHGVANTVLPMLIAAFEFKNVHTLYSTVDGMFPAHEPDPSHPAALMELGHAVKMRGAAVGIAFDGDADRVGAVDNEGAFIPGDKLFALLATPVLERYPGMGVVVDAKFCQATMAYLEQHHGQVYSCPTGQPSVRQALQATGALLAGELSGHFIFKDRYFPFDDGIYGALRLIEFVATEQKVLAGFMNRFAQLVCSPELRVACPAGQGAALVQTAKEYFLDKDVRMSLTDGVKIYKEHGQGLVRASHTESVLCFRFEATSALEITRIRDDFIAALGPALGHEYLQQRLVW